MVKTEYWKMNDSVFMKVSEDGIFKDTKSIPLAEVSKDVLDKFDEINGNYYSVIEGDIQAEAMEEESAANKHDAYVKDLKAESNVASTPDAVGSVLPDRLDADDEKSINDEIESVSSDEINSFVNENASKEPIEVEPIPPSDNSVSTFVGTLDQGSLSVDANVKSESLISSNSFQNDVSNGNVDSYVASVTKSDEVVVSNGTDKITANDDGVSIESTSVKVETTGKGYDFVQAPSHYNGHKIITKGEQEFEYETIEFIEAWLRRHSWMPEEAKYSAGNGLKYYDRVGNKPEDGKTREEKAAEDFEKISWYCLRAAKALRGKLYKKEK